MPDSDQKSRKPASLRMLANISVPSNRLLTASVESSTISTTATRSSITRMPITTPANRRSCSFISSKALKTMAVDDIDSMPPRNSALRWPKSSRCPAR